MKSRVRSAVLTVNAVTFALAGHAVAQDGPDVAYTDTQCIWNWGQVDGIRGYSLGSYTCNLGGENLQWGDTSPLLAMNAYRLVDGRLVQIGMSFVKNGTFAAAGSGCGLECNDEDGDVLGAGCRDIYGCLFNGGQAILGPRSGVNPFTGAYPGASGGLGDSIYKRLQIAQGDLEHDEALYFVEGQFVAADDAAAGNAMNNASYKQVTVGAGFDLEVVEPMYVGDGAIYAWRDHGLGIGLPDERVSIHAVEVPGEGLFHIANKVTDLGDGTWRYDYAIRNFNSHRAARAFVVPIPAGTNLTNIGFHDVEYHSGEPYDNTDWNVEVGESNIVWFSPATFEEDPDTNALRWGTMYNFWFEADRPRKNGLALLPLFRPGATEALAVTLSVPGDLPCAGADIDGNGTVDVEDLVHVILSWGPCPDCPADVSDDGVVDVEDLVVIILAWGDCG